jgi:5'-3' exonuclease
VLIAWDGPNGSKKRKLMDKNYKEGRSPIRLNRAVRNLTEAEELENKVWQQTRLFEYLNCLPIMQILIPEVEADDVISYATQLSDYSDWQKLIVSNDRDFLQLCDDNTVLYRPTKNEIFNKHKVIEEYGIHPNNMALARAIAGDSSDNLPGVRGVGLSGIKKRLTFLSEETSFTAGDVVDHCMQVESKLKFYQNISESEAIIDHNYKMMQLYSPQLSYQGKNKIKYVVREFECEFNKIEFLRMMIEDGFGEWDWSELKVKMNSIVADDSIDN